MSIIDTLITDRTSADVALLRQLNAKGWAAMTDEQRALYLSDQLKGAYKASDLNRVNAAMDYLVGRLKAQGINVPIKRSKIPHKQSSSKRLPEGHNELKWIESTGTQYINTLFNPNQDTRVVMDAQMTKEPGTNTAIYFGVRGGGGFFELYKAGSGEKLSFLYNASFSMAFTVDYLLRRTVEINKNTATVDGVTVSLDAGVFQSSIPLFLGADNNAGKAEAITALKTFASQIYDNGTLVRDYIPDMLDSGEVGLYDMVEGKFYPNAGTGVFLAGPRRVELPEGFTQVEWIASSGAQHVDTLFVPNSNTRLVMDTQPTVSATSFLFGGRTNSSANSASASFSLVQISGASLRSDYGSKETAISVSPLQRLIIDKNKNVTTVNGVTVTATAESFSGAYNLTLLTVNTAGTINATKTSAKVYSCQIYDNDPLARDYIPCITAEGEGGLYDLVTNEFYGNAGSGAFTYGDIVEWEPLPDVEVLDDFTWYDSDVPTPALLVEHLANVSTVRSALVAALPEIPADMDDGLTIAEANNIELVLVNMEQLINNMLSAWVYCAEIYSGEV